MILTDPAARLVIAHRGNRAHAPENTLEAFRQALALGPDALEFDVRLSRDGVAMVVHDPTVNRTTNGIGAIESLTRAEIQQLDAGWRFTSASGDHPYRGQGIAIPTLEEVLALVAGMPIIIEVKELRAVHETKRLLRRFAAENRTLVGSLHRPVMAQFYGGPIATCASMIDAARLLPRVITRRSDRPPFDVLSITPWYKGVPIPVIALTRVAARIGIATHVWTVNSARLANTLWRAGVSGILSDDPSLMLRARDASVFAGARSYSPP